MSPQSSGNTAKSGINVYTMMLIISFLALAIGAILLRLEHQRSGGWERGGSSPAPAAPAPEPTAYVAPELVPVGIEKFLA